jgi:glycosyltransferase involved in cell wall biosynthesis
MKVAFVVPWYGENIPGGAETHCRTLAEHLTAKGQAVEILTTCALDFYHWNNHYREGTYTVNGVPVRRFIVNTRDEAIFNRINAQLLNNLPLSSAEEQDFMRNMINSEGLYQFIERHSEEYYFVFTPYLFGTTYFGLAVAPERSFLMPCLHDESYAHMNIFKERFRQVSGFIFLSRSEMELAIRLYDLNDSRCHLLGAAVDTDIEADGKRFKRRFQVQEPFILYVGRRGSGKNTPLLQAYFDVYRQRRLDRHLKLVMIGSGAIDESFVHSDCIDLEFVEAQDKYDAYAAATVLCQPSINESFSLVLMESWVCGTPVLVNEACAVARDHVLESNGGLYFNDYPEFEACLDLFLDNRTARDAMAKNGRAYVVKNFNWGAIAENYAQLFRQVP